MEILQLKYFCDAAESENFSRTAEKFSVPTSNISQTVKRLESELGVSLFSRSANKIRLSESGRSFYEYAKQALLLLDKARESVLDSSEPKGEIRLVSGVARRVTTLAIERFKEKYPLAKFVIGHDTSERGNTFVISASAPKGAGYACELLADEKILVAVNRARLKTLGEVRSVSDLRDLPFVAMSSGANQNELTYEICRRHGFEPSVAVQTDDPSYVRKYVELDMGVAFVPEVSWRGLFSERVELIDVCEYERSIYLFRREDGAFSRTERLFYDELKDNFNKEFNRIAGVG